MREEKIRGNPDLLCSDKTGITPTLFVVCFFLLDSGYRSVVNLIFSFAAELKRSNEAFVDFNSVTRRVNKNFFLFLVTCTIFYKIRITKYF
jgi:hypothetical protein